MRRRIYSFVQQKVINLSEIMSKFLFFFRFGLARPHYDFKVLNRTSNERMIVRVILLCFFQFRHNFLSFL